MEELQQAIIDQFGKTEGKLVMDEVMDAFERIYDFDKTDFSETTKIKITYSYQTILKGLIEIKFFDYCIDIDFFSSNMNGDEIEDFRIY